MDVGLLMLATPGRAREIAQRAEAAGFSHLAFGDTQNIGPEVWGQLMLAATASTSVRLGTGVTNATSRDVAVTASAALALQEESGGRAFCGIGRGDSALAKIGRRPIPVGEFEQVLHAFVTTPQGRRAIGMPDQFEFHFDSSFRGHAQPVGGEQQGAPGDEYGGG